MIACRIVNGEKYFSIYISTSKEIVLPDSVETNEGLRKDAQQM